MRTRKLSKLEKYQRRPLVVSIKVKCGKREASEYKAVLPAVDAMTWYFLSASDAQRIFTENLNLGKTLSLNHATKRNAREYLGKIFEKK